MPYLKKTKTPHAPRTRGRAAGYIYLIVLMVLRTMSCTGFGNGA
jgi:hypothetical protein